jgi:hypothetical protein
MPFYLVATITKYKAGYSGKLAATVYYLQIEEHAQKLKSKIRPRLSLLLIQHIININCLFSDIYFKNNSELLSLYP